MSHQANTDSGFSATLFRLRGTDEYYYVPRGTEPFVQGADLTGTDLGDILRDGLAIHQIIDMYNDIQHITAFKDTVYKVAYLEELPIESVTLNQLGDNTA